MVRAKEVLAGRYEMADLLGVGGMGNVYRARDRVLHRDVAIKVLKDELSSDPATLKRFTREARIAASLSHPCIGAVFDFSEDSGRSFIVMELLRGSDLHKVLAERGPLPAGEALFIAAAVADALNHAHENKAVHRDIKPGNIFLTDGGDVKVTDFGIATAAAMAPLTVTGDILGTPYYLSPEQVRGEPATPASDIYSLGCVLFEMVTGKRPFEAESSMAVAMAHTSRTVPAARELAPSLPDGVDALIARAMAKAPEQRFSSAAEMAAEARAQSDGAATVAGVSPAGVSTAAGPAVTGVMGGPPTMVATPIPQRRKAAQRPGIVAGALVAAMAGIILLAQLCGGGSNATVRTPDFSGMTYQQASQRIDELGLKVRRGMVALSNQPAGRVYSQRPLPGVPVAKGSSVMLFVSSGKGARTPILLNLTVEQAAQVLGRAGLKGVIVQRVPGPNDGIIVDQDPDQGVLLKPGASVQLTVTQVPPQAGQAGHGTPGDDKGDGGKGKGKGKGDDD